MREFKITRSLTAICDWQKTSYGFRHLAKLLKDGQEIANEKACYYNRTWESFEYQTVLERLYKKAKLSKWEKKQFENVLKNGSKEESKHFKLIAGIAKMGDIICQDQKSKNDWKTRMLKAGLENKGLTMPEDWESLTEDEKEKRLNGAIDSI